MLELLAITPPDRPCPPSMVDAWIEGGVRNVRFAVLLRSPGRSPDATIAAHGELAAACSDAGLSTVLSAGPDDLEDALRVISRTGLRGLQLRGDPQDAALARARTKIGPDLLLGRSCHGSPQPGETWVDYTCVAPVFAPRTASPFVKHPVGLELLSQWCTPNRWIVALGGIDPSRARACVAAGARGVASIASFLGPPPCVAENVRRLVESLQAARDVPFDPPR